MWFHFLDQNWMRNPVFTGCVDGVFVLSIHRGAAKKNRNDKEENSMFHDPSVGKTSARAIQTWPWNSFDLRIESSAGPPSALRGFGGQPSLVFGVSSLAGQP
jgi:hypothetical protein